MRATASYSLLPELEPLDVFKDDGFVALEELGEGHLPEGKQDGTGSEAAAAGDLPGGGRTGGEKMQHDLRPRAGAEEAA